LSITKVCPKTRFCYSKTAYLGQFLGQVQDVGQIISRFCQDFSIFILGARQKDSEKNGVIQPLILYTVYIPWL